MNNTENSTNNLNDNGIYLLMEEITQESCASTIKWILQENLKKDKERKDHLKLMISSPGGNANACFALIDIMKGSQIPIHTYGIGMIASCGLLLFLTGEKGYRILTPNTSILSHQYSWGGKGKEHELFARVKEYSLTSERMIDHYKKCTGLNEKAIRKYLLPPEDVWLSAKEAKNYGICDEVKNMY